MFRCLYPVMGLAIFSLGLIAFPSAHAISDCPPLSEVTTVKLQCPARKDGKFIACNSPITLNIPDAYLTVGARKGFVGPVPYALYGNLQPACTQFKHGSLSVEREKGIRLELERTLDADREIHDKIKQAKNETVWQRISDRRYQNYDHYMAFADPKLDNSILVPKVREIDPPYVITCMGLGNENTNAPKSNCRLYTNYRGQLLVKTLFDASHLSEIPAVFKKTNKLLDQFYASSNK